ncbi:MAG: hemolysin III family protein [Planctomycetia bacterium]|nr:hemolysin III family protein [Planctomycetia bacterium]
METKPVPNVSLGEEIANAVSHGIGAVLSLASLILLVIHASLCAPPEYRVRITVGYVVFGLSLIFLYMMSTLYHAITHQKAKNIFQLLDHAAIFVLISGSYTAFCLAIFRDIRGILILSTVWALGIIGIVFSTILGARFKLFSLILYLAMGWMIVINYREFAANATPLTFWLVVAGGLAYTSGFVFYALQRYPWMHVVWHFFVLAGSILHIIAAYAAI